MTAKSLMIQGTTSDAGKSTIVAGLCRIFRRRGIDVAPFKPQNMALNSAVTVDGGEIGRAQALQAFACGIEPHTDMNPVLLKPNSASGAQVIIQGRPIGNMDARTFHKFKPEALKYVIESFERLRKKHDLILIEGAGSPAEINLRSGDIANMGFAEAVDCPVLLVADIDRGGVFAHLFGTLSLLSESEQKRTRGFIINKFRGDSALLMPGIDWLTEKTGKPTLGIVPLLKDFMLDAEDSLSRNGASAVRDTSAHKLNVVVADIPSISNHSDFDPLIVNNQIHLRFARTGRELQPADLLVLPGSKTVLSDLAFLEANHWRTAIEKHLRYGGKILGICGGLQMLGRKVFDPLQVESERTESNGLNLLEIETTLTAEKSLVRAEGNLNLPGRPRVSGYEIHCGRTSGAGLKSPAILLNDRTDGVISEDGQILGTYFHGLFEEKSACEALLRWAGLTAPASIDYDEHRAAALDQLADSLTAALDMGLVESFLRAR